MRCETGGGYTPIIRDIGLTDSVSIKRRDAGERQVLSEVRDGTRDSVQVGEDRYVLHSVRRRANGVSQILSQVRCKERRSDSSSVCEGGTPDTTSGTSQSCHSRGAPGNSVPVGRGSRLLIIHIG